MLLVISIILYIESTQEHCTSWRVLDKKTECNLFSVNTENVSSSQRIAGSGGRDGPGHWHVLSLPAD